MTSVCARLRAILQRMSTINNNNKQDFRVKAVWIRKAAVGQGANWINQVREICAVWEETIGKAQILVTRNIYCNNRIWEIGMCASNPTMWRVHQRVCENYKIEQGSYGTQCSVWERVVWFLETMWIVNINTSRCAAECTTWNRWIVTWI